MKACILRETGGPDRLTIEQVPEPAPGAGEVRVALKCAALNRRDVWITLDRYPGLKLPCTAGSDGAGVIDAVGKGVDTDLVGREVILYPAREWGLGLRSFGADFRVLGMPDQGTFAEAICVPVDTVVAKPAHLSWEEAAALPLAGLTAWRALMSQGETRPDSRVLITGIGGGVATFALLWAVTLGCETWVTSSSADKIATARRLGARGGFNYTEPGWDKQLLTASSGGVDVIVDGTQGDGFIDCFNALRPGGRLVTYGATGGAPSRGFNPAALFLRQVSIRGSTMGSPAEFANMVEFVNAHGIRPVVDSVHPFDDIVAAHELLLKAGHQGKVVLRFGH